MLDINLNISDNVAMVEGEKKMEQALSVEFIEDSKRLAAEFFSGKSKDSFTKEDIAAFAEKLKALDSYKHRFVA